MVGFIKNIFGSKSKNNNNNEEKPKRQKAFYLDPDEAKTYGNIDYMRQSTKTRKTFPKTLDNPEGSELVEEVSAMEKKSLSKSNSNQQNGKTNNQPSQEAQEGKMYSAKDDPSLQQRRKSDSSLDTFRNMARDIKKD
ncbi:hypothetical protein FRE64_12110 [Euhalothece natronophila Z-M001]|uniref:Uncharacterized protein n=1 Tax=Euhalothece natronophila Z-M001 TaxID=522448 RepID=A0A5B8NMU9_9CHRO|nr:hypothetical protein [Euhalothece natronophila]QDZ40633.1 hypothetical protein FRE64_12110 [Euhalothece natronophila Z-M001]